MFEIHKAQDEQYYVIVKAGNGEILLTSETYTRKENAENCINALMRIVLEAVTVPVKDMTGE